MKILRAGKIESDQLLTSHEVGSLLQVNPSSVNKWVSQGRIAAFRTPGGHRRIRAADLVEFLQVHRMPVPEILEGAAKRRLLLVDDDTAQLRAVMRLLTPYRDHVQVTTTTNGIDALVLVGSYKPHLIVLDMFMPELDGLEVCRRLQANPETRHIAVIVTSGQLTRQLEENAMKAGARRCLPKPIDLAAVLAELGVSAELSR